MSLYKINDICDINAKSVKSKEFNTISYLDTSSITRNSVTELQILKMSEAPSRAQRMLEDNSIVYSLVRPNLEHYGFFEHPISNMVVSTGFATLFVKKGYQDLIDARYLYLLLTQPSITNRLSQIAQNAVSAYPSLAPSDIEQLQFDFPSLKEQIIVADLFWSIDQKIALNREINRNLPLAA